MSVTQDTNPGNVGNPLGSTIGGTMAPISTAAPRTFRGKWKRFWKAPDPVLVDAGAAGELFVARLRFALTALLLCIPLATMLTARATDRPDMTSLTVAIFSTLIAGTVLMMIHGGYYKPWLGIATGILDVTLISAILLVFLVLGRPDIATNSFVVYPVYLLAIAATALRYDARTCVAAGVLAMLQYFLIVWYAMHRWDINSPQFAPHPYGLFDWNTQISREVLLAAGTLLSTSAVMRTQHWLKQSASDALTGLMNRGFFDERIEEEFLRARRYHRPLAIAMIDIDHFKMFNDTYGHAAGDHVLKIVAEKIGRGLRRTDVVARYGGEELACILPETDRDSAAHKAEMLRQQVEEATVAVRKAHGPVSVTISIGVASFPDDGQSASEVLDKADQRLYSAKRKGRNRVSGAMQRYVG